jgi:hypothetical protein
MRGAWGKGRRAEVVVSAQQALLNFQEKTLFNRASAFPRRANSGTAGNLNRPAKKKEERQMKMKSSIVTGVLFVFFIIQLNLAGVASAISVVFSDSGQNLGSSDSDDIAIGDLDGDEDLDAFVANSTIWTSANKVWLNDGEATFTDSGQSLGTSYSHCIELNDLDGDEDLDAFVANWNGPKKVWLNDGLGNFSAGWQSLTSSLSLEVALGDLDGDDDLDAFIVDDSGEGNEVWLNDGNGNFTDSGQALGNSDSFGVALGDVDGDDDLDAFVANRGPYSGYGSPDKVWLNDGQGVFSDSGQSLGWTKSYDAVLGDLDGDDDLDAFVANANRLNGPNNENKVWLNDGSGNFTDSGQLLGDSLSYSVALGDFDQDNDLDAFVVNTYGANKVWLNDGSGNFTDSGQSLGSLYSKGVAIGDFDGDNDLDAFIANFGGPNKVYLASRICNGDFNTDGDVDGSDLAVFAADFGRTDCSGDCEGDFDGDDDVDGSDLAIFAADFGRTDCP